MVFTVMSPPKTAVLTTLAASWTAIELAQVAAADRDLAVRLDVGDAARLEGRVAVQPGHDLLRRGRGGAREGARARPGTVTVPARTSPPFFVEIHVLAAVELDVERRARGADVERAGARAGDLARARVVSTGLRSPRGPCTKKFEAAKRPSCGGQGAVVQPSAVAERSAVTVVWSITALPFSRSVSTIVTTGLSPATKYVPLAGVETVRVDVELGDVARRPSSSSRAPSVTDIPTACP